MIQPLLSSHEDGLVIVASFVHGNALGVVLEPKSAADLPKSQRTALWKVCIGPLIAEVAAMPEFPTGDFTQVVFDLRRFLVSQGIPDAPVIKADVESSPSGSQALPSSGSNT
ncbi:MAG TPA: hypothetical protein VG826_24280 [Pirellulales bacterium]|nr:hypothetical protein [Pirellulales bacterium]